MFSPIPEISGYLIILPGQWTLASRTIVSQIIYPVIPYIVSDHDQPQLAPTSQLGRPVLDTMTRVGNHTFGVLCCAILGIRVGRQRHLNESFG